MADSTEDEDRPDINTLNEFFIGTGQNLPNHSTALAGRAKFVRSTLPNVPTFRTRQQAFRYCAWVLSMVDILPDEPGAHEFEEVLDAVRNT